VGHERAQRDHLRITWSPRLGYETNSDVVSCASAPTTVVGCVMNVEKLADELIALRCGTHARPAAWLRR
jgi:hypothetical protein